MIKRKFILILIMLLLLQGCEPETDNIFLQQNEEATDQENENVNKASGITSIDDSINNSIKDQAVENTIKTSYSLTKVDALLYLKEVLERTDYNDNSTCSIETKSFQNKEYNFLYISSDWCDELFRIELDEYGNIGNMVSAGGGLGCTFSYDIVSLSQGDYIAVYNASHMGNGSLDLYELEGIGEVKYSIFPVIDCHYEDMGATAVKYGLTKEYSDLIRASVVYKDDELDVSYEDYDGDGDTDIIASGVIMLYSNSLALKEDISAKTDNDTIIESCNESEYGYGDYINEIPLKQVYLYNEVTDTFDLIE